MLHSSDLGSTNGSRSSRPAPSPRNASAAHRSWPVGRLFVAATLGVLSGIANVAAQTYPSRPITIVVALPAGGGVDALARLLAEHMKSDARPADHRREHGRRRRHAFDRPDRTFATRRLHDRDGNARSIRDFGRGLYAAVRHAQRSRTGRVAAQRALLDGGAKGSAGKQSARNWHPGSKPTKPRRQPSARPAWHASAA